jgi:hypothetical protein
MVDHPPENLVFIEKKNKQKNHVHGRHNTLLDTNLIRSCMMLVVPNCYLNVLNMINSTPFPFFQNQSRIVELEDLQCNHGVVDDG